MATKKQRRRRAKEHRHDYMWVDDEGNEVEPEGTAGTDKGATGARGPRRDPQAPSWQRTFKRGAIFAPIMFGTVFLLSPNLPIATKISQTLLIVAIFIPFSYFLDRLFYRRAARQQQNGRRGS
jgi:hypothetical protein